MFRRLAGLYPATAAPVPAHDLRSWGRVDVAAGQNERRPEPILPRPINSGDGMTADAVLMPEQHLEQLARGLLNLSGVSAVVYGAFFSTSQMAAWPPGNAAPLSAPSSTPLDHAAGSARRSASRRINRIERAGSRR